MIATFKLEYTTGRNIDVDSRVIAEIDYDCDKRQFIQSVADMLGVVIAVNEGYAEKVFSGDSEQSEELHNED
jgi:hypothetical protein